MKRLFSLMLAFVMILSVTACGKQAVQTPTTTAAETTEATVPTVPVETAPPADQSAYPVQLTDHAGRDVTIPAEPARIVSGYYISTSALIALGVKDRLVGIEAKADKRPIYKLSAPELIDLPNVGTAKEFDLEGCIALEPDLVVLPMKLKSAAESLEALEIPVLLVNPESQELLLSMVDLLAQAAGVPDSAKALHIHITGLEDILAGIDEEAPSVYLAGNSGLLSTAGGNMYQSSLIEQAGGANVAAELTDNNWAEISYEQLLAWDPEYIILASDASYSVEDVLSDDNLADCRAVVNGNVFHMPGDAESWDSPVPSGILGSLWLASVLHPDSISADSFREYACNFYNTFYEFEYQPS